MLSLATILQSLTSTYTYTRVNLDTKLSRINPRIRWHRHDTYNFQLYISTLKLHFAELYNFSQRGSISVTFLKKYIVQATIFYSTTRNRELQEDF